MTNSSLPNNILTPKEIVQHLDRFVVGQHNAKKKVAVALRHRAIRRFVQGPLQSEITPKNILMIGPTGVGKSEIVRRLAQLLEAPFIKVEATKFTEVGYVGRDVESIIRELVDKAVKQLRDKAITDCQDKARASACNRVLEKLFPGANSEAAQDYRNDLLQGKFDEQEIEIELAHAIVDVEIMAPPGMEEMTSQLQQVFQTLGGERKRTRNIKVVDALRYLEEEESSKLIDDEEIKHQALELVEESGIVFIDEIDKVCQRHEHHGSDVSREGVQRDLLPLIEGCSVSTKYGMVKTDHILFITSGAFHLSKPSDLIPELQGRLPVRVELDSLSVKDFVEILSTTDASLISQYRALLEIENIKVEFTSLGIERLAEIAWSVNENTENIGARRLHTVMEKLLEDVFFHGSQEYPSLIVNEELVNQQLRALAESQDLSHFIL